MDIFYIHKYLKHEIISYFYSVVLIQYHESEKTPKDSNANFEIVSLRSTKITLFSKREKVKMNLRELNFYQVLNFGSKIIPSTKFPLHIRLRSSKMCFYLSFPYVFIVFHLRAKTLLNPSRFFT